ncbi:MAG: DUF421 domain-containing protein, partial [Thermoanaerobaculia bacterium]|nr:DUF421 domain-containing protein [Thermoanaerobaculia bacterium]
GRVSRAINGGADLTPTIAAGFALIALHWIFAAIAFRAGWFGRLVKGRPMTLIREGKYMHKNLSRAHITQRDLEEASRRQVGLEDPGSAKLVSLERSGEMSFVLRDDEEDRGEISEIDVDVKDGVKTVRIVLA